MPKIKEVSKFAAKLGFKIGDNVTDIGGYPFIDILDYLYYDNEQRFSISLIRDGRRVVIDVKKSEEQSVGLEFDLEIEPIRCKNKCVFCFVDQLPKGLRDTLYIKDDDYRLSFISGSYVTFTNVSEEEMQRIIRLKISPLYISVHAYDDELRRKMLRNPVTLSLIDNMRRLGAEGIKMHTQLVIVPEMNDGDELVKSIRGLHSVKGVETVAIVPVGLTGHRCGLDDLRAVKKHEAIKAIEDTERLNEEFGGEFCWCSDEYYMLAEKPLPKYEYYADFAQIENGVGLVADFLDNLEYSLSSCKQYNLNKKITMITGASFAQLLREYVKPIEAKLGVKITVKEVLNDFFGRSVTVAGLVVGGDIIKQVKPDGEDLFVVPDNMLREFTTTFLDNTTLDELSDAFGVPVIKVNHNGIDLPQDIVGFFKNKKREKKK